MSSERVTGQISTQGSSGKRRLSRLAAYLKVTAAIVALLGNNAAFAQQLPTGGTVAAGSATIGAPQNGTLNINQNSSQAVINWNAFSVGRGGTVNFNQPNSSSATLNRVTGSTPSWIAGTINAPGTVLLVNPNGIAVTKSGVINTGSFAASTLDISNADFMAGKYKFTGNGGSAAVRNSGRINVSDGGFAALLGGQVANNGVISARLGKVGLGAGELITLDLAGDGFLSVAVPSSQIGKLVDGSGALVSNRGKIRADGGSVFLSAATASNILRDAVNVPGSIRANSVGTHNGRIVIGGGDGGRVSVTGKLAANGGTKRNGGKIEVSGANVALSGKVLANGKTGGVITVASSGDVSVSGKVETRGNDGQGGRIDLTGANIKVIGALIDASGATGGGLIRIGGTFQGGHGDPNDPLYQSFIGRFGDLPAVASAQTVTIDGASVIDVSAKVAGNGGTVVVWSEQYTSYSGTIAGTSATGKGGFAEVSSHGVLDFVGMAELGATSGASGTLLLDPNNLVITGSGTDDVTSTSSGGTTSLTAAATTSNLKASTITALLNATTNVSVVASGDITVNSAISWTGTGSNGNTSLTLNAGGNLLVSANVTALKTSGTHTNNTITLIAGNDITIGSGITFTTSNNNTTGVNAITFLAGRNISIGSTVAVTNSGATNILLRADSGGTGVGTVTFASSSIKVSSSGGGIISIFYNPSVNPAGSAINSASYVNPTENFTANKGSGALYSYMLVNSLNDLQNMQNNLSGSYGLGKNIDASATSGWNGGLGFAPIGSAVSDGTGIPAANTTFGVSSANPFSGNFNGQNYTISNLTINRPNTDYVGLFGYAYATTGTQLIQNVNLVGGSITGRDHVGSVLGGSRGYLADGTGVTINFNDYNNFSTSSATVNGRDFVGGLYGSVETAYGYNVNGNGNVSGRDYVGGIVGWLNASSGFFTDFRSTATVSGRNNVGGMAGSFYASLYGTNYATGNVTATGDNVGGFVGNSMTGMSSGNTYYATGAVTGGNNVGGLVGFNGNTVVQAFATGAVTGVTNVGGLVGNNDATLAGGGSGFVDTSFATGVVNGTTNVGGLVGYNTNVIGALNNTGGNYATGAVYGTTNVGGLVGSNIGDSSATFGKIVSGYSIGYVSGTTNVGGLVGNSTVSGANAYIKNSYFNTETSGKSSALGTGSTGTGGIATGSMTKTTAQLQAALQTGFATAAWGLGTGVNISFPYFKWLYGSAPQVVSGYAYSDRGTTPLVGTAANMLVSGLSGTAATVAASAVGSTGSNGFFYFLVLNGTFAAAGKQVLVYTAGANGGATFQEKATASLDATASTPTGLVIYGTYLKEQATSTSTLLSTVNADLALAVNSNAAALTRLSSLANLEIDATAATFAIDQTVSTGTLLLSGTGAWTQSGAITATTLSLLGSGAIYTLTNASNAITNLGTVTLGSGSLNLVDTSGLTVTGVVGASGGVTLNTSGALVINNTVNAGAGNVSLTATGAGNAITQSAGGAITANTLALSTADSNAMLDTATNAVSALGNVSIGAGVLALKTATAGGLAVPGASITANGGIAVANTTGGITTTGVVQASNGAVALTAAAGNIVTGGSLIANGGSTTLTATNGSITLGGSLTGTGVSLTSATSLTLNQNIFANSGNVLLNATGANSNITQTSGRVQGAGLLATALNGSVNLTAGAANNGVATIAGRSSGNFAYTAAQSTAFTIGTVSGTSGIISSNGSVAVTLTNSATPITVGQAITASNGGVTLSSGGNLMVNAAVTANTGTGTVSLASTTGAINQNSSGVLTGNTLTLSTNGGNATLNTATNAITNLGATTLGTGALSLLDTGGLTVTGAVGATGGITINTSGLLGGGGSLNAGAGNVSLTVTGVSGGILFGGGITANTLTLSSDNGWATVNGLANAITNLGTVTLGTGLLNLVNAGDLTVTGAVGATGGISISTTGTLVINAALNGGTNLVQLQTMGAGNAISQSASGIITGDLYLTTSGGNATLDTATNAVSGGVNASLGAGALALKTANAGSLSVSSSFVTANGGIAVTNTTGGIATSGSLAASSGAVALNATAAGAGITLGGTITGVGVTLNSNAALAINQAINGGTGTVSLNVTGASNGITQSVAITADTLTLSTNGGNASLNSTTNAITNLGTTTLGAGSLNLRDTGGLTVAGAVIANGGATIRTTGGNLSIGAAGSVSSSAAGDAAVLSTDQNFVNNAGASAVQTPNGRWLVYSAAPSGNTFGSLDSGNAAIWNATYATLPPGSVTQPGNRYIFAQQPTLTITSTGTVTKTYGDDATVPVAGSSVTVSGLQGVANAFTDTASDVYSGAPVLTSTGSAATADVAGSPYGISAATGSLAALTGYAFAFVNNGTLTIDKATLTATANAASRDYGDANPTLSGSITGFKNGQTAATFGGDTWTTLAGLTSNVGNYGITGDLTNASPNYTITQAAANTTALTIDKATLTTTANAASRDYGDANPTLSGSITGFKNGQTAATFGGDTWTTLAGLTSNVGNYGITGGLTNASPNYTITQAAANTTALTIDKATLTATANAASRDYGDANPTLSGSITGFKNGQTAATFGGDTWTTLAGLTSNVGDYGITGGLTTAASNYTITQTAANTTALTINKATLTFTANTASRNVGDANPTLSGSITGFKNGQTATTFGGDIWSTLADQTSPAGSYAVAGNLTNATPNYRFVQMAGNLTALTVKTVPPTGTKGGTDTKTNGPDGNNPSQFNSRPDPNGAQKGVNISFQLQGAGPISVSFTPPAPPVRLSATSSTDVAPAALPSGQNLATNNGLTYQPISQLDPNQYSSFKTADWAAEAGEAAIFVMIARGMDQGHAADAMIDGFWNGTSASWTPQQSFAGKVTFSDGAGNTVTPTGNAGFPIVAGTTDFGLLLKSGPVMISNGATPAHWLLATQLTPDGKGIVANDPASGKQVVLNYDAASKTVGGVTSVFDAGSNKFVPFMEASIGTPPLAGLRGFTPANFLAVSTK